MAGHHSLVVECLLNMYEALGSIPSTEKTKNKNVQYKPDMVAHTSNPSSWEMEAKGLGVHICFEASLGYINPCLKKEFILLYVEIIFFVCFFF